MTSQINRDYETAISRNGYSIPKSQFTDKELTKLKKELTAEPIQQVGYVTQDTSFPIYLESPKKIYLPRYFGIQKYGLAKTNKLIGTGIPANLKFDGSLRPYQINIANIYLKAAKEIGGGLISIGCGRGKTVIGLYIAASINLKTIVVVHKEFLAEQWVERILGDAKKNIKGFLPTAKVGRLQGKIIDVEGKDIVIAMVQSLSQKDYPEELLKDFGLVIYDECHHLSAEIFSRALIKTSTQFTLGLSATPDRKDGLTHVFKYFLGDIVYQESQNEDKTILVKAIHYFNDDPEYSAEVQNRMGDPNRPQMINNICNCERRNKVIIQELQKLMDEGRKVLILSDRKEHLKYLMEQIESKIIKPVNEPTEIEKTEEKIEEPIEETTTEKKKKKRTSKVNVKVDEDGNVLDDAGPNKLYGKICGLYVGGMKQSDLKISEDKDIILGTYPMVSEGFDCPTLDTVILSSPKSDVVQSVGRILRKKPEDRDRQHIVIDIIDYVGSFASQWETRKKYYRKQKYQFDEYTYDDNSDETIIKNKVTKHRKLKTFKEEMSELSFIDENENQLETEKETKEKETKEKQQLSLDGFMIDN
jgi:superfamily II DNA or RNA helicase